MILLISTQDLIFTISTLYVKQRAFMSLILKMKWYFLFHIYRRDWYAKKVYNWSYNKRKTFNYNFIIICRIPYFLSKIMASRLCPRGNTTDNLILKAVQAFMSHRIVKKFCPCFYPCGVCLIHLHHPSWNLFLITYLKCTTVCYHFVNLTSQFSTSKYQMSL